MVSWKELNDKEPELAEFGKERFSTHVAYLGTVQKGDFPRIHPVTPIISSDNLFVFMEPTSPKGKDLNRNHKFFLHSSVTDSNGSNGEFWIKGLGYQVTNSNLRHEATISSSYKPADRYILFQLFIEQAGSTVYNDGDPSYRRWKAS